ncbi:peptide-methionine (S)-S-oxide reductase MsrA [Halocalculus aciditolerans]|uniref:Peptide methionine sulfoxide reductase MsrA n=1 Tax=Halocalculus aciditolerans TaxID=1383812 RepID=A0A830FNA4_9EURY|nr:peptide-methionine (S)-S-oxide reductase MsrA [Halocalculus aciditolerans]GGL69796.1 peptide methionine sulfoxide reductase MsrA [Halocalculus aciditolerans]
MSEHERATFAGGCFWCVEAVFKELRGVEEVTSGYAGGHVEDPSYEAVCEGDTGHAEVIEVAFDPEEITYEQLLAVFFTVHDPTTLNRQGPDVGSQYRSAVFYENDEQREAVESFVEELESEGVYEDIVTEVEPRTEFYEAEAYHQDYFEKNPGSTYCQVNTQPKLRKVREKYGDLLRE